LIINILNKIYMEIYGLQSRLKMGGWVGAPRVFRFLAVMLITSSLGLGLGCQYAYRVADDITGLLAS
jgi:hypothetical protein